MFYSHSLHLIPLIRKVKTFYSNSLLLVPLIRNVCQTLAKSITLATRCPVLVQPEAIATVAVVGAGDVITQLLALVLAALTLVDVCRDTNQSGWFYCMLTFSQNR